MTDEQIETALNACMFGQTKADRCKDCPLDSDKEPCITNLHLAALEYIGRLKHRAEVAERALRNITERASCNICDNFSCRYYEGINYDYNAEDCIKWWLAQAEKELAEKGKDEQS